MFGSLFYYVFSQLRTIVFDQLISHWLAAGRDGLLRKEREVLQ